MWTYERKLQYPVKIKTPNPALAKVILTQFGGPDGELGAANRYLSQRYTMPYKEVTGVLTDVGMSVVKLRIKNFGKIIKRSPTHQAPQVLSLDVHRNSYLYYTSTTTFMQHTNIISNNNLWHRLQYAILYVCL